MKRILKNIMHKTFVFATLFIIIRIWIANEIIVKLIWTNVIIFISATLYLGTINLVQYLLED